MGHKFFVIFSPSFDTYEDAEEQARELTKETKYQFDVMAIYELLAEEAT